jgi:hypothetical protein
MVSIVRNHTSKGSRRARLLLSCAAGAAVVGGVLAAAAPASAIIAPHVSVHTYQAYNYADSYGQVQHWNKVGGKYIYGNWAPRGTWSNQSSCWTGVQDYWYNFKS